MRAITQRTHLEAWWIGQVQSDVHYRGGSHITKRRHDEYKGIKVPISLRQFVLVLRSILSSPKPIVHDFESQQAEHLPHKHRHSLDEGVGELPDLSILSLGRNCIRPSNKDKKKARSANSGIPEIAFHTWCSAYLWILWPPSAGQSSLCTVPNPFPTNVISF